MSNHVGGPPEWMTADYLEDKLRTALNKPSLAVLEHTISTGSCVGDNFVGMILRVSVQLKDEDTTWSLQLIGKHLKDTPLMETVKQHMDLFAVELSMFQNIFPRMREKLGGEELVPRLVFADEEHKTLFMNDLCAEGFRLSERSPAADLDHAVLVVEALAKLHAATMQIIQEDHDLKAKYGPYFHREEVDLIRKVVQSGYDAMMEVLPTWPASEKLKEKLLKLKDVFLKKTFESSAKNERHLNTLIHGDCWLNNMMFRYDEGQVQEVRFVDFQLSNYHSVAFELVYFIFSSTNPDVQEGKLDLLLSKYYTTLVGIVGDIPGFSLACLKEQLVERLFFGLAGAIGFSPCLIKLKDKVLDLEDIVADKGHDQSAYTNPELINYFLQVLPVYEKYNVL